MARNGINAVLRLERTDFLVFSGEFSGFPAEYALSFVHGRFAKGMVLIPDTEDGAVFAKATETFTTNIGPSDETRDPGNGINYIWYFQSSYNPPPDFAYIAIGKERIASFINDSKDQHGAAVVMSDADLEREYRAMRSSAPYR